MEVIRTSSEAEFEEKVRQRILEAGVSALERQGAYLLVLSGGETPKGAYRGLAEMGGGLDWSKVHVFWGDERAVPLDHPDSNYRMAREALLDRINIPEQNVHPIPTQFHAYKAATKYEEVLREVFENTGRTSSKGEGEDQDGDQGESDEQVIPAFDLILLGVGADGHTASLFPGTTALGEERYWVTANYVESMKSWRITLTPPIIRAADQVLVVASGEEKSGIVARVLGEGNQDDPPAIARVLEGARKVTWIVDAKAAVNLTS